MFHGMLLSQKKKKAHSLGCCSTRCGKIIFHDDKFLHHHHVFLVHGAVVAQAATTSERLDKPDPKEPKQVYDRGNPRDYRGDLHEHEDVQRGWVPDLVTPAVEQEVGDGEEEGEE